VLRFRKQLLTLIDDNFPLGTTDVDPVELAEKTFLKVAQPKPWRWLTENNPWVKPIHQQYDFIVEGMLVTTKFMFEGSVLDMGNVSEFMDACKTVAERERKKAEPFNAAPGGYVQPEPVAHALPKPVPKQPTGGREYYFTANQAQWIKNKRCQPCYEADAPYPSSVTMKKTPYQWEQHFKTGKHKRNMDSYGKKNLTLSSFTQEQQTWIADKNCGLCASRGHPFGAKSRPSQPKGPTLPQWLAHFRSQEHQISVDTFTYPGSPERSPVALETELSPAEETESESDAFLEGYTAPKTRTQAAVERGDAVLQPVYNEAQRAAQYGVPPGPVIDVKIEEVAKAKAERLAAGRLAADRQKARAADPLQMDMPGLEPVDSPSREGSPVIIFPGHGEQDRASSPVSLAQHEEEPVAQQPPKRQPGAIMLGLIALFLLTWATLN
jgi:hypothetical protein